MKLYDLGKNHCDYFNQFIPNPAQPEPKPDEESRDEGVGSEKQNDQIQNTGSIIASTGKYTICLLYTRWAATWRRDWLSQSCWPV